MSTTDHDAITKIAEETGATRALMATLVADFRVLRTKLLGDDEEELPTGRLPQVEARVDRLERRQDRQARLMWMASGFVLCLNAIGWLYSHVSGVIKK